MKKLLFLLFIASILYACETSTKLEFHTVDYTSKNVCDSEQFCPHIDIELLKANGDQSLSKLINNTLEARLIDDLSIDPNDRDSITTIAKGLTYFIKSYNEFKKDFSESPAIYEINASSQISYDSEDILSIAYESYSYWGGAHGYGSTTYYNFDKKTAQILHPENLFKSVSDFKIVAERAFRAQQNISEESTINSSGYFFKDDEFTLPQNIGFKPNELILIYNPYEVAPYAEGQITISIPLKNIKKNLVIH